MKKIFLIFGVLSFLIFIRPALGLNASPTNTVTAPVIEQTEEIANDSFVKEAFNGIKQFYNYTGFANSTSGNLLMILIGIILFVGIKKNVFKSFLAISSISYS